MKIVHRTARLLGLFLLFCQHSPAELLDKNLEACSRAPEFNLTQPTQNETALKDLFGATKKTPFSDVLPKDTASKSLNVKDDQLKLLGLQRNLAIALKCPKGSPLIEMVTQAIDAEISRNGERRNYATYRGEEDPKALIFNKLAEGYHVLKNTTALLQIEDAKIKAAWADPILKQTDAQLKQFANAFGHGDKEFITLMNHGSSKVNGRRLELEAPFTGLDNIVDGIAKKIAEKKGRLESLTPSELSFVFYLHNQTDNLIGNFETERLKERLRGRDVKAVPQIDSDAALLKAAKEGMPKKDKDPEFKILRTVPPQVILKSERDLLEYLRLSRLPENDYLLTAEVKFELEGWKGNLRKFIIAQIENLRTNASSPLLSAEEAKDWKKRWTTEIALLNTYGWLSVINPDYKSPVGPGDSLDEFSDSGKFVQERATRQKSAEQDRKNHGQGRTTPQSLQEVDNQMAPLDRRVEDYTKQGLPTKAREALYRLPATLREELRKKASTAPRATSKEGREGKEKVMRAIHYPDIDAISDLMTNDGKDPQAVLELARRVLKNPVLGTKPFRELSQKERDDLVDWAGKELYTKDPADPKKLKLRDRTQDELAALVLLTNTLEEAGHLGEDLERLRKLRGENLRHSAEITASRHSEFKAARESAVSRRKSEVETLAKLVQEGNRNLPSTSQLSLYKLSDSDMKLLLYLRDVLLGQGLRRQFEDLVVAADSKSIQDTFYLYAPELYGQLVAKEVIPPIQSDVEGERIATQRKLRKELAQDLADRTLANNEDFTKEIHDKKIELAQLRAEAHVGLTYGLSPAQFIQEVTKMQALKDQGQANEEELAWLEKVKKEVQEVLEKDKETLDGEIRSLAVENLYDRKISDGDKKKFNRAADTLLTPLIEDAEARKAEIQAHENKHDFREKHAAGLGKHVSTLEEKNGPLSKLNLLEFDPETGKPIPADRVEELKKLSAWRAQERERMESELNEFRLQKARDRIGNQKRFDREFERALYCSEHKETDEGCKDVPTVPVVAEKIRKEQLESYENEAEEENEFLAHLQEQENKLQFTEHAENSIASYNLHRKAEAIARNYVNEHIAPTLKGEDEEIEATTDRLIEEATSSIEGHYGHEMGIQVAGKLGHQGGDNVVKVGRGGLVDDLYRKLQTDMTSGKEGLRIDPKVARAKVEESDNAGIKKNQARDAELKRILAILQPLGIEWDGIEPKFRNAKLWLLSEGLIQGKVTEGTSRNELTPQAKKLIQALRDLGPFTASGRDTYETLLEKVKAQEVRGNLDTFFPIGDNTIAAARISSPDEKDPFRRVLFYERSKLSQDARKAYEENLLLLEPIEKLIAEKSKFGFGFSNPSGSWGRIRDEIYMPGRSQNHTGARRGLNWNTRTVTNEKGELLLDVKQGELEERFARNQDLLKQSGSIPVKGQVGSNVRRADTIWNEFANGAYRSQKKFGALESDAYYKIMGHMDQVTDGLINAGIYASTAGVSGILQAGLAAGRLATVGRAMKVLEVGSKLERAELSRKALWGAQTANAVIKLGNAAQAGQHAIWGMGGAMALEDVAINSWQWYQHRKYLAKQKAGEELVNPGEDLPSYMDQDGDFQLDAEYKGIHHHAEDYLGAANHAFRTFGLARLMPASYVPVIPKGLEGAANLFMGSEANNIIHHYTTNVPESSEHPFWSWNAMQSRALQNAHTAVWGLSGLQNAGRGLASNLARKGASYGVNASVNVSSTMFDHYIMNGGRSQLYGNYSTKDPVEAIGYKLAGTFFMDAGGLHMLNTTHSTRPVNKLLEGKTPIEQFTDADKKAIFKGGYEVGVADKRIHKGSPGAEEMVKHIARARGLITTGEPYEQLWAKIQEAQRGPAEPTTTWTKWGGKKISKMNSRKKTLGQVIGEVAQEEVAADRASFLSIKNSANVEAALAANKYRPHLFMGLQTEGLSGRFSNVIRFAANHPMNEIDPGHVHKFIGGFQAYRKANPKMTLGDYVTYFKRLNNYEGHRATDVYYPAWVENVLGLNPEYQK